MIRILLILGLISVCANLYAQEYGSNFNHNPEIIDFDYLERVKVDWIRTTPRILDYVDGKLEVETDPGLGKVIEAGNRGYKVVFGFRWDFKMRRKRIPMPDSFEEKLLFLYATHILERVGPHTDIFTLGNEPNLETLPEDMTAGPEGVIPLVRFTERLMTEVVLPYYDRHREYALPKLYVGSLPALFEPKQQTIPGVSGLIRLAQRDDRIAGLALHLHISDTTEIDSAFQYARSIMPEKTIIVPEFSLHRLYKTRLTEALGGSPAGRQFAEKYGFDKELPLYKWYSRANTHRVTPQEWLAFFQSRDWYPEHYLQIYARKYKRYGVVLATFPLLQQSCPEQLTATSPAWFINPVFCQHSLTLDDQGDYARNPLVFDDFVNLVQRGKWRR